MDGEDIDHWVRNKLAQGLTPTLVGLSKEFYKSQTDIALHDVKKMCRERKEYELYETPNKVIAIRRVHNGCVDNGAEEEEEDESFDSEKDCDAYRNGSQGKGVVPSDDGIETEERHTIEVEIPKNDVLNALKEIKDDEVSSYGIKLKPNTPLPNDLIKKIEEHESMVRKMAPKQKKIRAKKPDGPSSAKRRSYYDLMRKMHPKAKPPKKYGMSDEDYIKWVEGASGYNDVVGSYERAHGINKEVKRVSLNKTPGDRLLEMQAQANIEKAKEQKLSDDQCAEQAKADFVKRFPHEPKKDKVTTKEILNDIDDLTNEVGINRVNKGMGIAVLVLISSAKKELEGIVLMEHPIARTRVSNALECLQGVEKLIS
jgi:hypothetical protein